MLDLHLHLLPGVDDGAESMAVTEVMLRRAEDMGYETLVTTPHLVEPLTAIYRSQVESAFDHLQAAAERTRMKTLLGYEIVLTPDLPDRLMDGEPITLAGSRAVLVELPFVGWPHHAEGTLFALQTGGYRPILAHPERCAALQDDSERGLRLAERGVILQVTIGSLVGLFGERTRRTAETWLREGAVGLVATDAHSAGRRLASVPKGLARLDRLVGRSERHRLTVDMPTALLRDDPVLPAPADGPDVLPGWQRLNVRKRFARGR